tara:strand:- start:1864 stop:2469 length:606 start_codon:yes stop_codon:yes gene_type:complete
MKSIFYNKHHFKYNWIGYTAGLIAIAGLSAQIEITYRRKTAGDLSYILIGSRILILSLWLWYGINNEIPPTIFSAVTGLILTIILLSLKIHYEGNDNNNNNDNTKNWGEKYWDLMHTVSYTYPNNPTIEDKMYIQDFYESICNFLPCDDCKQESKKYIENNPIQFENRTEIIEWVLNFHNFINIRLNKKIWNIDQLNKKYL